LIGGCVTLDPDQSRRIRSEIFKKRDINREDSTMTGNVGVVDRFARVLVGLLLIAFAVGWLWPDTGWNWVGWIGIVPLVTGLLGSCPAYGILGVSTCGARRPA
jgi:hypothetical protein